ncbi:MAG: hypothetical protein H5T85_07260 [Actinobacteria bacterium]|nr:hypothetical protein [Actinomycetota bacterium]
MADIPRKYGGSGIVSGAYFMAFVGAAVYFIKDAPSFWIGVLGFLKAIVWPAFLIYNLFQYLQR